MTPEENEKARQFLNFNASPQFAENKPSAWENIKNKIMDNKGAVVTGVLGAGTAGYLGSEIDNSLNQDNIENLANGKKALQQNMDNYNQLELDKLNPNEHYQYTQDIRSTNQEVQGFLKDIAGSKSGVGDVGESKEVLADHIYEKRDDGKSIYDTLDPETQKALKAADVIDGYTNGRFDSFHSTGSEHDTIQDNIEKMGEDRDNAIITQEGFKNDQPGIALQNNQYVVDQKAQLQSIQDAQIQSNIENQKSIDSHLDNKKFVTSGSAVAGMLAGVGAKKLYDKADAEKMAEKAGYYGAAGVVGAQYTGSKIKDGAIKGLEIQQNMENWNNNQKAASELTIPNNPRDPFPVQSNTKVNTKVNTNTESSAEKIGPLDPNISHPFPLPGTEKIPSGLPTVPKPPFMMEPTSHPINYGGQVPQNGVDNITSHKTYDPDAQQRSAIGVPSIQSSKVRV